MREIDVCLCNGVLGTDTKMYLLQYPLRPPWRPYDLDQCETVNFKPGARRLELTTALDIRGHNYNSQADPSKKLNSLMLKSQSVDLPASFAVGCLRGDTLMLAPLDEALQMRPQLRHLDESKKATKDEDMLDEEEKIPSFVTVQVQRRETERQAEQRVNSYAYIARQEADEKWKQLNCASADSSVAGSLWDRLMTPPAETASLASMPRASYLSALTSDTGQADVRVSSRQQGTHSGKDVNVTGQALESPAVAGRAGTNAAAMGASGSQPSANGLSMQNGAGPDGLEIAALEPATQKALLPALLVMFKQHSVVNLADIRQWLSTYGEAGSARDAAAVSNKLLHTALLKTGMVTSVKAVYVQTKVANGGIADALRSVLLNLLKDKPGVKRSEVFDSARAEGLNVPDGVYQKVMKELCTSRGNLWSLKSGA